MIDVFFQSLSNKLLIRCVFFMRALRTRKSYDRRPETHNFIHFEVRSQYLGNFQGFMHCLLILPFSISFFSLLFFSYPVEWTENHVSSASVQSPKRECCMMLHDDSIEHAGLAVETHAMLSNDASRPRGMIGTIC